MEVGDKPCCIPLPLEEIYWQDIQGELSEVKSSRDS